MAAVILAMDWWLSEEEIRGKLFGKTEEII